VVYSGGKPHLSGLSYLAMQPATSDLNFSVPSYKPSAKGIKYEKAVEFFSGPSPAGPSHQVQLGVVQKASRNNGCFY